MRFHTLSSSSMFPHFLLLIIVFLSYFFYHPFLVLSFLPLALQPLPIKLLPYHDPSSPPHHISPPFFHSFRTDAHAAFFYVEAACNAWFTFEILMRFSVTPMKLEFVKNTINIIDFVATLSFYMDIILNYTQFAGSGE